MQDSVLLASLYDNNSLSLLISESDEEIRSKLTIAQTKQQRILSRLPPFRSDPEVSRKTIDRDRKRSKYDPPMSDRESWWRVTVKVRCT
jgi:hypothetical protein